MSDGDPGKETAALRAAIRWLARRPLTECEMRRRLAERGHSAEEAEAVCGRLSQRGWLDDARLAADFVVARAERLGHGRRRLIEDLERRGVTPAVARRAWEGAVESGEISPTELLRRNVERRLSAVEAPIDRRAYARVYNALLRAGFEEQEIRRELDPRADPALLDEAIADDGSDDRDGDRMNDEFA